MTQDPRPSASPIQYAPRAPFFRQALAAGWLMTGIGILMLLGGGCFVGCGFFIHSVQFPPDQAQKLQQLQSQMHLSMSTMFFAMGTVFAVAGIYHIVMGFFVRRAKRWATYTAVVTTILIILWCGLNALGSLAMGANAAVGICFLFLIAGVFVWQLVWLIQAIRTLGSSAAAAAQHQAQYWQMLAQQQAYGQPAAAGVPPPPAGLIPPPPQPPQPPSPEPTGWAYGQQTPPPPPPPPRPPPEGSP